MDGDTTDIGRAAVDAWSRLLAYLVVVTMVSITIMIPVAGVVLASAAVLLLRGADLAATSATSATSGPRGRRSLRAAAGAVLSLSYAVSAGVVVAVALVSLVSVGISADPLVACAWGAGAGVYVLWAGPGVRVPCRRLARVVAATVPGSRLIGLAGITLSALAFLAIAGAVAFRPSFAPMYGLQNTLQSELVHLQSEVQDRTG